MYCTHWQINDDDDDESIVGIHPLPIGTGTSRLHTLRKPLNPAFPVRNPAFPVRNYIFSILIVSFVIAIKLKNGWFPAPDLLYTLT